MILRRLVDSLRRQDWGSVLVEVGIVVLGVFLGIEVANWNEHRQSRAAAQSYLQRLEADLASQVSNWENVKAYFQQTQSHARSALDGYLEPASALDEGFLVDLYQASQERWLTNRRATYDELVATGGIEYLDDPRLRDALASNYDVSRRWLAVIDDRSNYREVLRQTMDHRVQSAIVEACGDVYIQTDFGIEGMRLPEQCEVELPPELVRSEVTRLHGDPELLRHLRFQSATLRSRLAAIDTAVVGSRNTLAAVRDAKGATP